MSLTFVQPPQAPKPTLLQRILNATGISKAMERNLGLTNGYFSPGVPPTPQAPATFEARKEDYRVGYNINIQPRVDEPISFWDLYALAENDNITRLLIETRKDQMAALSWNITPVGIDEDEEATDEQKVRIKATTEFFQSPDGEHSFTDWLRMLLEDVLVYDAPCLYVNENDPLRTRFQVVSGMTITRKVDINGRTPEAPETAYQQIIHGTVAQNFSTDEMIYKPRNLRPNRIYGCSPVQQIVMTVNIALRKQMSQLYYFSEGTIPDALITVPPEWTPKQISDFQNAWDDMLTGNLAQKRHAKFVPGGTSIEMTKPAVLTDAADEWFTKIRCYAFSIPNTAFSGNVTRATAHVAKAAANEEGLEPLMKWAKSVVDLCVQKHLGQYDLEFDWVQDDVVDPNDQVTMLDTQLRSGTITFNEYRKQMGRDSYGKIGDEPMVFTASGPILLKNIINPPAPGEPGGPPLPEPGMDGGGSANGKKPATANGGDAGRLTDNQATQDDKKDLTGRPRTALRLLKDDGRSTLYVHRPLLNGEEFVAWAKEQGFSQTLTPHDLHVTVAFSRQAVDWDMAGLAPGIVRSTTGIRSVEPLGDKGAVVLKFSSLQLQNRWQQFRDMGCSWDYPGYQPHVTISYQGGDVDLSNVDPYTGVLEFGPEVFGEVVEDCEKGVKETAAIAGVGKSANRPFVFRVPSGIEKANPNIARAGTRPRVPGRRFRNSPINTKVNRASEKALEEELIKAFKEMAAGVAKQLRSYKQKVAKAADDEDIDPDDLNANLTVDLSPLDQMATGEFPKSFADTYTDAGLTTIAIIGAKAGEDVVNQINTRALAYARFRSAELVGKKWVLRNGKWVLINNPNAEWAITESTREMLADLIVAGLQDGLGVDGLADAIMEMTDSEEIGAFSAGRARMIARTETLTAHGQGDLAGLQTAADNGVNVLKEWYCDAEACPICLENQDAGPIPLDDVFPSGDDAPTAHPNCECSLNAYLPDEEGATPAGDDVEDADPDEIEAAARVRKYSPDQPRDERGRFGSGGFSNTQVNQVEDPQNNSVFEDQSADATDALFLTGYTDTQYSKINRSLRKDTWRGTDRERDIQHLDKIIAGSKTKQDIVTFRAGETFDQAKWNGVEGKQLMFAAYTSSTLDHEVAENFSPHGGATLYRIAVPSGSNALNVNHVMNYRGNNKAEHEVILPRGSNFVVERVNVPTREVHLRLVP